METNCAECVVVVDGRGGGDWEFVQVMLLSGHREDSWLTRLRHAWLTLRGHERNWLEFMDAASADALIAALCLARQTAFGPQVGLLQAVVR